MQDRFSRSGYRNSAVAVDRIYSFYVWKGRCGNMSEIAAAIKNVSFQYQNVNDNALNNIDLTIFKGECVLLCGDSGSGKTSVTRLLNGLIPHYYEGVLSGETTVFARNIVDTPIEALAGTVGSVFLKPPQSVFLRGHNNRDRLTGCLIGVFSTYRAAKSKRSRAPTLRLCSPIFLYLTSRLQISILIPSSSLKVSCGFEKKRQNDCYCGASFGVAFFTLRQSDPYGKRTYCRRV